MAGRDKDHGVSIRVTSTVGKHRAARGITKIINILRIYRENVAVSYVTSKKSTFLEYFRKMSSYSIIFRGFFLIKGGI